jgi:hypothetical protein
MYPSWASFKAYGHLIYNAIDTPQSNYYLTGLPIVSSYVQNQILYMSPNATNPLQYVVFVQNAITLSGIPSVVKVLKYNHISGNGILINELITTTTSGAPIVLDAGEQYIFQAYSLTGNVLLKAEPPFVAIACSTSTCSYYIQVGNVVTPLPAANLSDIISTCTVSAGINATTNTVSCSVSSVSGQAYTYTLNVTKTQGYQTTGACQQSLTASSGALSCLNMGNTSAMPFDWKLTVQLQTGGYTLRFGSFGTPPNTLYGNDGVFIAAIIIAALVLLVITKNPILGIISFDAGFMLCSLTGLIYAPPVVLGFMLMMSVLIAYIVYKQLR